MLSFSDYEIVNYLEYPILFKYMSLEDQRRYVQYIKGNTSRKLQMEYKEWNKQFWGHHLWARGYFVASSGNVTDEVINFIQVYEP